MTEKLRREDISGDWKKGCLATAILLIIFPTVYFLLAGYKPQLLFNPITRYLYPQREARHGDVISLIPDVFNVGDPEAEVLNRIRSAGFERWTLGEWDQEAGIDYVFRIGAGSSLVCGYDFFVRLDFNAEGELLAAENERSGGCL